MSISVAPGPNGGLIGRDRNGQALAVVAVDHLNPTQRQDLAGIYRLLAATIDPIREAFTDARDHAECPVVCELCGDTLADSDCPDCYGSGGTASGDECQGCEGARKIHVGCVGVSHRDLMKNLAALTEERDEQLAAIAEWQRSALIVITAANQFVMDCVTGDGNPVTIAKALIDSGFDGRNER